MTTGTINESQRKAARVAGFFYLLTFAIVVAVNFGINERLIVAGDATQTAATSWRTSGSSHRNRQQPGVRGRAVGPT